MRYAVGIQVPINASVLDAKIALLKGFDDQYKPSEIEVFINDTSAGGTGGGYMVRIPDKSAAQKNRGIRSFFFQRSLVYPQPSRRKGCSEKPATAATSALQDPRFFKVFGKYLYFCASAMNSEESHILVAPIKTQVSAALVYDWTLVVSLGGPLTTHAGDSMCARQSKDDCLVYRALSTFSSPLPLPVGHACSTVVVCLRHVYSP